MDPQTLCVNCNSAVRSTNKFVHEIFVRIPDKSSEGIKKMRVQNALSSIYKLPFNREIGLCKKCGRVLKNLMKYYLQLNYLRKVESYLSKEIGQLEETIIIEERLQGTGVLHEKDDPVESSQNLRATLISSCRHPGPWVQLDRLRPKDIRPVINYEPFDDSDGHDSDDPPEISNGFDPDFQLDSDTDLPIRSEAEPSMPLKCDDPSTTTEMNVEIKVEPPDIISESFENFQTTKDLPHHNSQTSRPQRQSESRPEITRESDEGSSDSSSKDNSYRVSKKRRLSPSKKTKVKKVDSARLKPSEKEKKPKEKKKRIRTKPRKKSSYIPPLRYICPVPNCLKAFPNNSHLVRHSQIHTDPSYTCDVCQQEFSRAETLARHKEIHIENPINCPNQLCKRRFETQDKLGLHLIKCQKATECRFCGKLFKRNCELKYHMLSHGKERRFTCAEPGCGKKYMQRNQLRIHERAAHTGERPFKCPSEGCQSAFTSKNALTIHSVIHDPAKNVICEQCGVSFRTTGTLRLHMRRHTGEMPYVCQYCQRPFAHLRALKNHVLTHTQEKPHLCSECGVAFRQQRSLKRHMQVHTGEKPYKCSKCHVAFSDKRPLVKHMLNHETQETMEGNEKALTTLDTV